MKVIPASVLQYQAAVANDFNSVVLVEWSEHEFSKKPVQTASKATTIRASVCESMCFCVGERTAECVG